MAQSKRRQLHVVDHTDPDTLRSDGESATGIESAADPTSTSVSGILKSTREQTGLTVWEVSQNLRIRFTYMQAIEDGRFDDLPGPVYAIGFIRTYALYLNLDADDMIRRFKNEQSGLTERRNLVFPAPPPAPRVSGVAIGLVALLLAAAAYGGWYYLSRQNDQEVAVVAPLPDRFATLLDRPALSDDVTTPTPAVTEDTAPESAGIPAPSPEPDGPDTLVISSQAETDSPDLPDGPIAPSEGSGDLPDEAGQDFLAVGAVGAAPLDLAESEALGALVSAEPEPAVDDAVEIAAPPEPPAAPEPETQPAVGGVRIEMRATTDSWVLIRDAGGDMIMTRVMTPGDSYQVPDEAGLTLFTGNAGGLEVLVDGQAVPPLGGSGEVIRNISLDPDLLRDGRAVISQ